jgi:hypothetical protein
MLVRTVDEFRRSLRSGPPVQVFALENADFTDEYRGVFRDAVALYKSSMFIRFCTVQQPLSEDPSFLQAIHGVSCLIVNSTQSTALSKDLGVELSGVPLYVCSRDDLSV